MIISCPRCETTFFLADALCRPGRRGRCSLCGNIFFLSEASGGSDGARSVSGKSADNGAAVAGREPCAPYAVEAAAPDSLPDMSKPDASEPKSEFFSGRATAVAVFVAVLLLFLSVYGGLGVFRSLEGNLSVLFGTVGNEPSFSVGEEYGPSLAEEHPGAEDKDSLAEPPGGVNDNVEKTDGPPFSSADQAVGWSFLEKQGQDEALVRDIFLEDVRQFQTFNEKAGDLLIIQGYAVNGSGKSLDHIAVTVRLLDSDKQPLASARTLCGAQPTLFQLQHLDLAELRDVLDNPTTILFTNTNVPPQGRVPFAAVLPRPEGMHSFEALASGAREPQRQ